MDERCRNCPEYLCTVENQVICYLENVFLGASDINLRHRLVRAVYAFSATLEIPIFREEFMSVEDEIELVEIKTIISDQYRKELMSDE